MNKIYESDSVSAENVSQDVTLAEVFWQKRIFILICTLIGLLIAFGMAVRSPKIYQARASFFALEGSRYSRSNSILPNSEMGSFLTSTIPARTKIARQLLLIIYSRSLAKEVIKTMPDEIGNYFMPGANKNNPMYIERLAEALRHSVFVDLTNHVKPPVMVVNLRDPKLAVKLANKYLDVLHLFIKKNSLNQEAKNRAYLTEQVKAYEVKLNAAEEALRKYEVANKLISLGSQARGALDVVHKLKSDLIVKERELDILKNSPVAQKSDIRKLEGQVASMKKQIDFQESGARSNSTAENYMEIIKGGIEAIPDLTIAHNRLVRERDNMQKIYSMLVEKLELAKLKEQMTPTSFIVLDPAVTARRIAPRVRVQSLYGGIVGFFLACGYLMLLTLFKPVTNKN